MRSFVEWCDAEPGFALASQYIEETDEYIQGGKLGLTKIQREVLGHCLTPDEHGKLPYTTIVFSAPKKSGKTTIGAAIGMWFAEEGPPGSEIYSIANDQEQATDRVFADICYDAVNNRGIMPKKHEIRMPNGTVFRAVAQEHKSAAGGRQALTIWDELWGYTTERSMQMWSEMQPIPTVPISLRVVVTYAGYVGKSNLLEDLYHKVMDNGEPVAELAHIVDEQGTPVCWHKGRIFMYWDTVPRMPWQTDAYYDTALDENRPSEFLRLHRNQWVTGMEEFIPIEMWDGCVTLDKPLDLLPEDPRKQLSIVIAVDASTKHDCTATVGVYFDTQRGVVGEAFHHIWTPKPGEPIDLELTVEASILAAKKMGYRISLIGYDPTQLARSMMTLKKLGFNVMEFTQSVGNMVAASQNLYNLLKSKSFETFPDPEAREHVRFSVAENKGAGFRITKADRTGKGKPNDYTIALAIAAYLSVVNQGADVSQALHMEIPFADASGFKEEAKVLGLDESKLAWIFRE